MKTNIAKIKEHLDGIPDRRLPLGKNAWLHEWNETKEYVNMFERELRDMLALWQMHERRHVAKINLAKEILGDSE